MTIIKPSTAFKAGADWVSAEVRAYIKDQVATHLDTAQDVRDNDFEQTRFLYVRTKAATYRLDLSSGAVDDGDTVLRDNVGRRYIKVSGSGSAMAWDVQVDDLAGRAAYDGEDAGFSVLVADTGSGRAAVYERVGAAGNWTDPAYLTGQQGDAYLEYGVSIYKSDGIAPGGYYADRLAVAGSEQDTLYVEIIDGDPGSEIDIYIEVDGLLAYGPFTVEAGSPQTVTGASVNVAAGDPVSWVITAIIGGTVRDVFAKSYGVI